MTPEQIKAKAEEVYNGNHNICINCCNHYQVHEFDTLKCPTYPDSGKWLNTMFESGNNSLRRQAFTAGAEWMQGEMEKVNTRPTDMEQEAMEVMNKYTFPLILSPIGTKDCLTAMTEFGEMWRERGREEGVTILNNNVTDKEQAEVWGNAAVNAMDTIEVLQQQLAEKDKKIEYYEKYWNERMLGVNQAIEEFTAAKAEIERLKEESSNAFRDSEEDI